MVASEEREYQRDYSAIHFDKMHDTAIRSNKAKKIVSILNDYFGEEINQSRCLDIGCSTGFVSFYLRETTGFVVGMDIDTTAIKFANANFTMFGSHFILADSLYLPFPDASFDICICSHIYEHVPDAQVLINEIYRVLKPGGACYFAAGNIFQFIEPHYNLPFLSLLPQGIADFMLRISGRGDRYYEKHLSYWGLKKITASFNVIDYTKLVIERPDRFSASKLALAILRIAYWVCPTYIWILIKPGDQADIPVEELGG